MPAPLPNRSALALLAALSLALACGLMAAGPLALPELPLSAGWGSLAAAGVPLVLAASWGGWALAGSRCCPPELRRPLGAFFAVSALHGALGALQFPGGVAGTLVLHGLAALGALTVMQAFLAERLHAVLGGWAALAGAAALSGLALAWAGTGGDLRALAFLQWVPLVLLPAGLKVGPGRFSRDADWIVLGCLYGAARLADGLSLPLAYLLGLVLVVAWVAWQLVRRAEQRVRHDQLGAAASLASTASNTSG